MPRGATKPTSPSGSAGFSNGGKWGAQASGDSERLYAPAGPRKGAAL